MNARNIWPPVSRWSSGQATRFGGLVLLLAVLTYLVVRVPEVGVGGLLGESAPYWFAKLLLDVLVLGYVTTRSRWTGPKLVGALLLVYAGLQVVSFVEIYLYGMITQGEVLTGAAASLLQGGVVVIAVVLAFGSLRGDEGPVADDRLQFSVAEWTWKLAALAVAFLVLMILAGLVVFEGLAQLLDPQARAGYEIVEPPAWILPFQLVRGIVFTALLLPVIALFAGDRRETMVAVAVLFGTLLASNMIAGYEAVPGLLWVAHFFELFGQAFVYGLLAVWLLSRHHSPVETLRRRLRRRRLAPQSGD